MIRLKQHALNVHHERIKKYSIIEHCYNTKYYICFENVEFLASIPHYYKRRVREALEIEKFKDNLNRDDGMKLKEAWEPVVRTIRNNPHSNTIIESQNPIH